MDVRRETVERAIADMQRQAAQLASSEEWIDQCEQALLATAILLHRNMLADAPDQPAT